MSADGVVVEYVEAESVDYQKAYVEKTKQVAALTAALQAKNAKLLKQSERIDEQANIISQLDREAYKSQKAGEASHKDTQHARHLEHKAHNAAKKARRALVAREEAIKVLRLDIATLLGVIRGLS